MINEFKQLTHGVYVIGVGHAHLRNAFTASWLMQVSFVPPLIAFSINPRHYSYTLLRESGACSINILGKEQLYLAERFGQAHTSDKMAGFHWLEDKTGAPILRDCLAYFDCTVSHYTEAGDHVLVICHVITAKTLHQGKPLLYADTGNLDESEDLYAK